MSERHKQLSAITGLPITDSADFQEPDQTLGITNQTFTTETIFGNPTEQYRLAINVAINDRWGNIWCPKVSWSVSYNGQCLFQKTTAVYISDRFSHDDLSDNHKVEAYLSELSAQIIGGLRPELSYMDFESWNLKEIQENQSLYANAYLIIMVHQKERGLAMPPILLKNLDIKTAMALGDEATLNRLLAGITLFESASLDQRCQAHLFAEAQVIREQAALIKRRRDPAVPLEEVYNLDIATVEAGSTIFGPHNILVIEKDLKHRGYFRDFVLTALEVDGRYKDSEVMVEISLPDCLDLCSSGRIDLVVFDWTPLDFWELLRVQGAINSLFNLVYGDNNSRAHLSLDGSGQLQADLADGQHFNEQTMKEAAEHLDHSRLWMSTIADACHQAGFLPPPYFTARGFQEKVNIGNIISQVLGHPLR